MILQSLVGCLFPFQQGNLTKTKGRTRSSSFQAWCDIEEAKCAAVLLEPGIGSKCFLKRDKFPFVREDICKIYYLGSCELAPDLKHTGIGQMAMTSQ